GVVGGGGGRPQEGGGRREAEPDRGAGVPEHGAGEALVRLRGVPRAEGDAPAGRQGEHDHGGRRVLARGPARRSDPWPTPSRRSRRPPTTSSPPIPVRPVASASAPWSRTC